jgi:hypothetical protein
VKADKTGSAGHQHGRIACCSTLGHRMGCHSR